MANINLSLIDLKALSVPATKLIETVGGAIGAVYEPTRIRRRAKAEADATLIQARADAEAGVIMALGEAATGEMAGRTTHRLAARELRRQGNIEAITQQALDYLPESVSNDPVDEDWVYQFYEHSHDIGDEKMQSLWARLLAGEVAKPGSFSLRTLEVVKTLSRQDAELFTAICTFAWFNARGEYFPFRRKTEAWGEEEYLDYGINFTKLLNLESNGLVRFDQIAQFTMFTTGTDIIVYYGRPHRIESPNNTNMSIGDLLFTKPGEELIPIAGGQPNEDYRSAAIEDMIKQGFTVTEIEDES